MMEVLSFGMYIRNFFGCGELNPVVFVALCCVAVWVLYCAVLCYAVWDVKASPFLPLCMLALPAQHEDASLMCCIPAVAHNILTFQRSVQAPNSPLLLVHKQLLLNTNPAGGQLLRVTPVTRTCVSTTTTAGLNPVP